MRKCIVLASLVGFLLLGTTTVNAQEAVAVQAEMTAAEKKAAKAAAKEEKRRQKEEAAESAEMDKMEKAEAKAEKKQEKRDRNREKFEAFIANWEPTDVSGIDAEKMPETIRFFEESNQLFGLMKEVESYIGFIQIEISEEDENGMTEMTITNTNTGEPIEKNDALKVHTQASLDLTTAALTATNAALIGVSALTEMAANPLLALTLGRQVKGTLNAVKYSAIAIPLIQQKIGDNTAALKQSKNN